MDMFPAFLVDWAHHWGAANAAQSWSVVSAPRRDGIHFSDYEELLNEHLKIKIGKVSWYHTGCLSMYGLI